MPRLILDESRLHPAIRERIATHHRDVVDEVDAATRAHAIVVVGMKQNPHPRRARRLLDSRGLAYHYLEYGSYLNTWRRRTAIKLWSGWPTFPMVFVRGVLIGGADELARLDASGELAAMLAG
ncbi:MAG: glutaredoxin [Kofleriaceae bacterium]